MLPKEHFKSEESTTDIYCEPDACDECSQSFFLTMEPEKEVKWTCLQRLQSLMN